MKKVLVLSLSVIEKDNRVIRQCEALNKAGFKVMAYGLANNSNEKSPELFNVYHYGSIAKELYEENNPDKGLSSFQDPGKLPKKETLYRKLVIINRKFLDFFEEKAPSLLEFYRSISIFIRNVIRSVELINYIKCYLDVRGEWKKIYWRSHMHWEMFEDIKLLEPDCIVANDWHLLPLAKELANQRQIPFAYDSHEHAISENNHNFLARTLKSKYLFQLEKENLEGASYITSVSQGITDALKEQYNIDCEYKAVRNTPYYEEVKFREIKSDDKIKVYYHGYMKENRNLDVILQALPILGEDYELIFRGCHESSRNYENQLSRMAKELGVAERFKLYPLADHHELMEKTSEGDIGLSVPPLNSLHSDMALPNKFFEYIMAGQAVCVSSVKEMSSLIEQHSLGKVIQEITPEGIAETIKSISREEINNSKQRSLELAKTFCWEKEQEILIGLAQKHFT